jgi:protein-L-isoaspartate(D-aspartate) O-methyltransferase
MDESELAVLRRAYAKQVLAPFGLKDPRLEAAFAELRREEFLPPGPWKIVCGDSYTSPSDDPIYVYQDTPVGIVPEKGLNNGQPSFLAHLISLGRLREGEHAVHIGTGFGYYTAVISRLVGTGGSVTAIEYEPELAAETARRLSRFHNTRVLQGDGTAVALAPADVIYVNAGTTGPVAAWLDALNDGGRLILPITALPAEPDDRIWGGAIFLIERNGDTYSACWEGGTWIYPCMGARDPTAESALRRAFEQGGGEKVARLYRSNDVPEDRCWARGPDWCLAYQ